MLRGLSAACARYTAWINRSYVTYALPSNELPRTLFAESGLYMTLLALLNSVRNSSHRPGLVSGDW